MDKFKELQEQHQVTPKEENPFLSKTPSLVFNEDQSENVNVDLSVTEPDQSPVLPQTLEPEVIDNQVQPDTPPTDHEGEE